MTKRILLFDSGSPVLRGGVRGRGARGGAQRGKDVGFYAVKTLNLFSIMLCSGRGAGNASPNGARRVPPMMVQHGGAIRTAAGM